MGNDVSTMDLVIHIDENLDAEQRGSLLATMRGAKGVIAVGYHDEIPHLMIVVFNPKSMTSADVLNLVKNSGFHAELTGG